MRSQTLIQGLALYLITATSVSAVCNSDNAIQRKEYSAMTDDERKAYVAAMQCMMALPSLYAPGVVPASKNYFSDFIATHADAAMSVHKSGVFLSWHREYLWLMEKALHEQCDYPEKLGLPYWNWPKYLDQPLTESKIFDGSPTSLSGNGQPKDDNPSLNLTDIQVSFGLSLPEDMSTPPQTGGGCVVSGPFGNITLYLGPFSPPAISSGLPANWTEPNPHCFTRNLFDAVLQTTSTQANIDNLLAQDNITNFQQTFNSIHGGGHITVGGPMADFFVSPSDPVFYLHHGNIDRLWATWQAQDPAARRYAYNGTSTFQNPIGVTPEVDNSTVIEFSVLGNSITLGEAANPMAGHYCYQYA